MFHKAGIIENNSWKTIVCSFLLQTSHSSQPMSIPTNQLIPRFSIRVVSGEEGVIALHTNGHAVNGDLVWGIASEKYFHIKFRK